MPNVEKIIERGGKGEGNGNLSESNMNTSQSQECKVFYKTEDLFNREGKGEKKGAILSKTDNERGETYLISKTTNGEETIFSFQKIEGVFGTNPQATVVSITFSDNNYQVNFSWGGVGGYTPTEAKSIKNPREKEEFEKICIDFMNNILEKNSSK